MVMIQDAKTGKVYLISPEEIKMRTHTNNFDEYLPMFFKNIYNEGFGLWNEDGPQDIVYK